MIRAWCDRLFRPGMVLCGIFIVLSVGPTVAAAPFGEGVFGAHIPFGSATSLSIALSGNVSMTLTPSGSNFTGSGSNTVTVTSTDPVGYNLYMLAPAGTAMTGLSANIPASGNTTAGALAVNTWGYNTDGSSNYLGILSTPSLIKSGTGPFESGDTTTVTYGVLTDNVKPEDSYSVSVTYTVVALND